MFKISNVKLHEWLAIIAFFNSALIAVFDNEWFYFILFVNAVVWVIMSSYNRQLLNSLLIPSLFEED